jgi:hypothetical protein
MVIALNIPRISSEVMRAAPRSDDRERGVLSLERFGAFRIMKISFETLARASATGSRL